ncbi:GAF domain-containing sensor histidine kinase [Longimicrobium sp.]|uniref:sensor histidine kinase n=1 Tax=Longimicrobium sp. TaxID=2029185 RepID=UPI002B57A699|nr:GAF domain-containing sensor histidine kinase [Longimicrobium sp.]HSU12492.1 GAF domain-containing sensor histidine kinase [Longimicrobium sp.]
MRATRIARPLPRSLREPADALLLPRDHAPRRTRPVATGRTERTIALLEMRAGVAAAANLGGTAAGALRTALQEICTRLGWQAGRAVVLDAAGRATDVLWHGSPRRFAAFREASMAVAAADGRGVAGRALAAGGPVWAADVDEDPTLAVWLAARQAGLRSALAFPVMAAGRAVAVVEAWASQNEAEDAAVLDACVFAARQLGAAFEREAERAALRAEADSLRAVVAAAPAGAVAFGADGEPALWSSVAAELLGGSPESGGWQPVRKAAGEAIRAGRPSTLSLRTAGDRPLKLRLSPVTVADGAQGAAGWVWKQRAARPAAPAPAVQAETASRWADQALATVAHDLRSPLTGITLAAETLLRAKSAGGEQGPEAMLLGSICNAAERMREMVNDLLDASRVDGGAIPIAPREVELGALLRDAADAQRLQAADRGIALSVEEFPACTVAADARRVAQVFQNLVGNALAHTPGGGRVTLSAAIRGGEVRVSVRDTGRGIAAADLPRVFERFWRAADARGKGAGLGLSIVRGIVEAHGGTVRADSTVGEGTTMTFTLPLAEELAMAA